MAEPALRAVAEDLKRTVRAQRRLDDGQDLILACWF